MAGSQTLPHRASSSIYPVFPPEHVINSVQIIVTLVIYIYTHKVLCISFTCITTNCIMIVILLFLDVKPFENIAGSVPTPGTVPGTQQALGTLCLVNEE